MRPGTSPTPAAKARSAAAGQPQQQSPLPSRRPAPYSPGERGAGAGAMGSTTTLSRRSPGGRQVATAPRPIGPQVVANDPGSVAEWKRQLENTKKEMREIKALEGQMKWTLQREEKASVVTVKKDNEQEIMDWRWKQHDEMKEYMADKEYVIKEAELQENKEFVEFKRDHKLVVKEEDRQYNEEEYLVDRDNAEWRTAVAKGINEREKEVVAERFDNMIEVKEIRNDQKLEEKESTVQDRAHAQNLEMQNMVRQLQKEKDAMLDSLQYSRQRQNAAPLKNSASASRSLRN